MVARTPVASPPLAGLPAADCEALGRLYRERAVAAQACEEVAALRAVLLENAAMRHQLLVGQGGATRGRRTARRESADRPPPTSPQHRRRVKTVWEARQAGTPSEEGDEEEGGKASRRKSDLGATLAAVQHHAAAPRYPPPGKPDNPPLPYTYFPAPDTLIGRAALDALGVTQHRSYALKARQPGNAPRPAPRPAITKRVVDACGTVGWGFDGVEGPPEPPPPLVALLADRPAAADRPDVPGTEEAREAGRVTSTASKEKVHAAGEARRAVEGAAGTSVGTADETGEAEAPAPAQVLHPPSDDGDADADATLAGPPRGESGLMDATVPILPSPIATCADHPPDAGTPEVCAAAAAAPGGSIDESPLPTPLAALPRSTSPTRAMFHATYDSVHKVAVHAPLEGPGPACFRTASTGVGSSASGRYTSELAIGGPDVGTRVAVSPRAARALFPTFSKMQRRWDGGAAAAQACEHEGGTGAPQEPRAASASVGSCCSLRLEDLPVGEFARGPSQRVSPSPSC
eukprot:TRINITY_DN30369_c0_g1_i1.p1 TRINITY_DN30369_c0_g1~~TRINITY_DN30369_c0_g1_i1.p1  ORF type:complete len:518 (+),score=122.65 TRINITY_DN30369_c0_g1_i1:66-1619(+)